MTFSFSKADLKSWSVGLSYVQPCTRLLNGEKGEKKIARHKEGKRAVVIPPLPPFPSRPILSPLSPNGGAFHGLICVRIGGGVFEVGSK